MKKFYFSALIFIFFSIPSFSQECDPMADPFCESDTDIPLDSGAGILIAAATYYGIKKNRKTVKSE